MSNNHLIVMILPAFVFVVWQKNQQFKIYPFVLSKIKVFINLRKGQLDDPKKIARDVSNIGHWGNGDYEIHLSNSDQINYLMTLIRQSYDKNV